MIDPQSLERIIVRTISDARVSIIDDTGTMDHYSITVRSRQFAGKPLLEQHRLVYAALGDALKDGRVHAVQLTTIAAE